MYNVKNCNIYKAYSETERERKTDKMIKQMWQNVNN